MSFDGVKGLKRDGNLGEEEGLKDQHAVQRKAR